MNLWNFVGKNVKIVAINGKTFQGKVTDCFYPEENDLGQDSIVVDDILSGDFVEFPEDDIKSIEIIE